MGIPEAERRNFSCIWDKLNQDCLKHISCFLSSSDVACGLRLVNKAVAAMLCEPQHVTIHLSDAVPHEEFSRRWDRPAAFRGLSHAKRLKFCCLTVASGSVPNLKVAVANAGCAITWDIVVAAVVAGQLDSCRWLKEQLGCLWLGGSLTSTLRAAALAGQRRVCEWLLESGCELCYLATGAAAIGGHVQLLDWLVQRLQLPYPLAPGTLNHAAKGCDLPTLQRLHRDFLQQHGGVRMPRLRVVGLANAAGSCTPDWRAKVEWLEGLGCSRTPAACTQAARLPDAVERLMWLRERGYQLSANAVFYEVATRGDVSALQSLLELNYRPNGEAASAAASSGHLEFLQALHTAGCDLELPYSIHAAAQAGHLHVVAWLLDTWGAAARLNDLFLTGSAAESGEMGVLALLREPGCPWGEYIWSCAAVGGCEAMLEWLAAQGCPMEDNGEPYMRAVASSDLATLGCLCRLGCPWGPAGKVFTEAAKSSRNPMAVLHWLLEAECPVEWDMAEAAARQRGDAEEEAEVVAWIRAQRSLRQE